MLRVLAIGVVAAGLAGCRARGLTVEPGGMRPLTIRWQRLVDDAGETCDRCRKTDRALLEAHRRLKEVLAPLGFDVRLAKATLDHDAFVAQPLESNRIWIGDESLEALLDAQVGQSLCRDACDDNECRTIVVDGKTYEAISAELIIKAGLLVASRSLPLDPGDDTPACTDAAACPSTATAPGKSACCDEDKASRARNGRDDRPRP